MKVLLASCILLSLYITQVEPTFTTGNCPVIPLIRNIDFSRYRGRWYELQRLPNEFEFGLKCNQAVYGQGFNPDGSVNPKRLSVLNTAISYFFNMTSSVDGFAEPYNLAEPNKLNVNLNVNFLGQALLSSGDYNIIDTNYYGYSIVYTCKERDYFFFKLKKEYAWILTRARTVDENSLESLRSRLAPYTDISLLQSTPQDCY